MQQEIEFELSIVTILPVCEMSLIGMDLFADWGLFSGSHTAVLAVISDIYR